MADVFFVLRPTCHVGCCVNKEGYVTPVRTNFVFRLEESCSTIFDAANEQPIVARSLRQSISVKVDQYGVEEAPESGEPVSLLKRCVDRKATSKLAEDEEGMEVEARRGRGC